MPILALYFIAHSKIFCPQHSAAFCNIPLKIFPTSSFWRECKPLARFEWVAPFITNNEFVFSDQMQWSDFRNCKQQRQLNINPRIIFVLLSTFDRFDLPWRENNFLNKYSYLVIFKHSVSICFSFIADVTRRCLKLAFIKST